MQVIQQYANGMNPEVPPYLALGELQRRETAQKQMATAQGGMSGPQPSIKEQVEQKAGLMAAQGLQQQQMMQQMAQQRAPGPVPAGMPQPEAQPTMMARGGLAHAPVDFNFQHGGIVAFNGEDGSDVKYETPYDRMTRKNREDAERPDRKKDNEGILKALALLAAPLAAAGDVVAAPVRGLYGMTQHGDTSMTPLMDARAKYLASSENAPAAESFASEMQPNARAPSNSVSEAQATAKAGPRAAAPIADLKALAAQTQRQQAPRPMPAPAAATETPAAPTQPAPDSMEAMLRAQLAEKPKTRTQAELIAEQKAIREGAGMTEPAGAAQMERLRKMQEQYDSSKPSGLDDLIRVFGQAGQYKGLSGLAPAYTANQQQKRAADMDMARKMNELMGGVETTQRGEMKDIATGALAGLGVDRAAGEAARKDKMQALSQGRGQDVTAKTAEEQRKTQERGQDLQYKAQMAQVAATKEAREAGADNKTIVAAEAAFARDPEAAALKKQLESPILANNPTKAAVVIQRLRAIQASKYQQFGITLEGAPGAASPGGTSTTGWGKAQVVKP